MFGINLLAERGWVSENLLRSPRLEAVFFLMFIFKEAALLSTTGRMIEHKNEVLKLFTLGAWVLGQRALGPTWGPLGCYVNYPQGGSAEKVRLTQGAELSIQPGMSRVCKRALDK